ncbi:DNA-methyltransferase [Clostridium sp. M14]|uniref:DNA-methyltransferase n=1 Tax=Clostridium sp. M14 TaxID=2716311 RepID=UPI0013EECD2F|nr:site-specific DNA-methyltransferase [Clostridium sp. M14]MBZ9693283.1 site-specific DNA-methyltransferase [Clostridium sp. M14]
MQEIKDKSIDMILCDLPYGQTARNKWDTVIPFDDLWKHYNRIIKDKGAIVLFANGMFTADLMIGNKKMWKYNLIWDKVLASGHLNAKKMPMRQHEDICVFYKKPPIYNPQMVEGEECHSVGKAKGISQEVHSRNTNYREFTKVETKGNLKYPKSILTFQKPHPSTTLHPTQKPVELLEWLINTYSNQDDLILDNCMGVGSTGVGCIKTNRNFIGIELDDTYFKSGKNRINKYIEENKLNNIVVDIEQDIMGE